jgi:FtsH-binding integral membrane protein
VIVFGGYIQKYIDESDYGTAGCYLFLITLAVLFTVIIAAEFLDIASLSLEINMFFTLAFLMFFFMADTQLILGGRYGKISKDEWIFASMKLFADFILIFGLLL